MSPSGVSAADVIVALALVAAVVLVLRERAAMERRLTEHQQLHAITIASIGDAVITSDPNGRIRTMNAAACALTGYAEACVRGTAVESVLRLVRASDGEIVESPVTRALREGRPVFLEERCVLVNRTGQHVHVDDSAAPIRDASGTVRGVVVVFRDVTVQREQEATIVARTRELARESDALGLAHVMIRGLDGRIQQWRAGAETLYGFAPSEAVGRISHELLLTEFPAPLEEIEAALHRDDQWEGELVHVSKDGTRRCVAAHWALQRDETGAPLRVVEVNNDMTAAKAALEELERAGSKLRSAYDELRTADAQKNDFMAMLGHELRSPLATIATALELVRSSMAEPDRRAAEEVIGRQVAHAVRLTEDLLDIGRIASGRLTIRFEPIDLREVVTRAIESTRTVIAAHGHALELDIPASPVAALGDPARLQQVISNLVTNAAKYTDDGGHIRVSLATHDGTATLRVRDTGVGIPPQVASGIFELYAQVDETAPRSQRGLGIGLALVKRLVQMHEGTVAVKSGGRGLGSEFTVRLPLQPAEAPRPRKPGRELAVPPPLMRDIAARSESAASSYRGIA